MTNYIPLIPLRVAFNNKPFDIGVQHSNIASVTQALGADGEFDESAARMHFHSSVVIDPNYGTCSSCNIAKPVAEVLSYIDSYIRESQIAFYAEAQKRRLQIT